MRNKPSVHTKCVANHYAAPNERIIEFSVGNDGTGGLIAFRLANDGTLMVDVYRTNGPVTVRHEES